MKPNNRGLTLVELVVVIAIMGILFSLSAMGISAMNSARQKQAAVSVSAMISKTRAGSLSKNGEVYLLLSVNAQDEILCEYYEGGVLITAESFPAAGQSLNYSLKSVSGGSVANHALAGRPLRLSFQRSTGAQKPQDGYVCTAIYFSGAATRTLSLVPATGAQSLS